MGRAPQTPTLRRGARDRILLASLVVSCACACGGDAGEQAQPNAAGRAGTQADGTAASSGARASRLDAGLAGGVAPDAGRAPSGGSAGSVVRGGTGGTAAPRAGSSGSGPAGHGSSDLPPAPNGTDHPRPVDGGAPQLRALPWAGFKAAASYTFDDSQPSQVAHFDAIAATSAKVTWYLNTSNNWIEDYDAVFGRALAAGHELGNHTVHHCNADLSGCNGALANLELEIDQCSAYIEDSLHAPKVLSIAYPFGDTGYIAAAKQRFLLGRGVGDGMVAPNDDTDPFNLPVKAAAGGEGTAVFSDAIDQAQAQGKWVIFLFHSLLPSDQNWYAGVDVNSVTGSIEHAESLADVWLGTVADVGAYWLGQRALTSAGQSASGADTIYRWQLPEHFPPERFVRVTVAGGTLLQAGVALEWDAHGYYEVALDPGELVWTP